MNIREKLNRIFELCLELTPDYDVYREFKEFPWVQFDTDPTESYIFLYCYENRYKHRNSDRKEFKIYIENGKKSLERADECIAYLEALLGKEELL